jgi:hypothetical protein
LKVGLTKTANFDEVHADFQKQLEDRATERRLKAETEKALEEEAKVQAKKDLDEKADAEAKEANASDDLEA